MLFDKKERVRCKHLVFYDMVLYNNEVFQTGGEIKHGKKHGKSPFYWGKDWIKKYPAARPPQRRRSAQWQSRFW